MCEDQSFYEKPTDVVKYENENIVLPCRVSNLIGNVQWSKDGFMLGFDKDIPGYPRYSMVVEKERGIYNLLIQKAQRMDAGRYECQVSGKESESIKPMRASAEVIVLRKLWNVNKGSGLLLNSTAAGRRSTAKPKITPSDDNTTSSTEESTSFPQSGKHDGISTSTSKQPDTTAASTSTSTVEDEIRVSVAINYNDPGVELQLDGGEDSLTLEIEASSEKVEENFDPELESYDLSTDVADTDTEESKTEESFDTTNQEDLPGDEFFSIYDEGVEGESDGETNEEEPLIKDDLQIGEESSGGSISESPQLDDFDESSSLSPEAEIAQVGKMVAEIERLKKSLAEVEENPSTVSTSEEEPAFGSSKDIIWLVVIFDVILVVLLLIAFVAILSLKAYHRHHKSFDISNVTYV